MLLRMKPWALLLGVLTIFGCNKCQGSNEKIDVTDIKALLDRSDVKEGVESATFKIIEVAEGSGVAIEDGQTAVVHYTGWLTDGKSFDSSRSRSEPFQFPLGAGRVISGWDQGVSGMKPGAKRILVIPAEMGYGPGGYPGVIPPNATLIFEVELVEIRS